MSAKDNVREVSSDYRSAKGVNSKDGDSVGRDEHWESRDTETGMDVAVNEEIGVHVCTAIGRAIFGSQGGCGDESTESSKSRDEFGSDAHDDH